MSYRLIFHRTVFEFEHFQCLVHQVLVPLQLFQHETEEIALALQVHHEHRVQTHKPGADGLLGVLATAPAGPATVEVDGVVDDQRVVALHDQFDQPPVLGAGPAAARTHVDSTWPAATAMCASSGEGAVRVDEQFQLSCRCAPHDPGAA